MKEDKKNIYNIYQEINISQNVSIGEEDLEEDLEEQAKKDPYKEITTG